MFEPTEDVCPVCAGAALFGRIQRARDEEVREQIPKDANKRPDPRKPDPADGRQTFMRLLSPEEAAERRKKP